MYSTSTDTCRWAMRGRMREGRISKMLTLFFLLLQSPVVARLKKLLSVSTFTSHLPGRINLWQTSQRQWSHFACYLPRFANYLLCISNWKYRFKTLDGHTGLLRIGHSELFSAKYCVFFLGRRGRGSCRWNAHGWPWWKQRRTILESGGTLIKTLSGYVIGTWIMAYI